MTIEEKLRQMHSARQFEPFICHIRFPHYKNLTSNARIDFTYALTALVGPNGTNKSSVLRALFGVPGYNNLGNFWFSTKVDPIADTGDRPRFIYGYFNSHANQVVEVIKTRIHREDKPDYWEPSRSLLKDGMAPIPALPEGVDESPGRHKTRWENIKKEVIYIDFRSEISAYDKYFYHGELYQTLKIRTKQDFIRRRSSFLRSAIDGNLTSLVKYGHERILENRLLSDSERRAIASILNRKYTSIRHIRHKFFGLVGHSVILQHRDLTYSEAFAGSGEFAVVMLVVKVFSAAEKSLILLDEPEVSLHPGAQEALIDFLLDQIKRKKHQVVLSTHSPSIIRGLPKDAIKTFHLDQSTGRVIVQPATMPEEAFFHLGEPLPGRIRVLVEDRLGAELVRTAIRPLGEAVANAFEVVHVPGGAQTLTTKYFPVFAMEGRADTIVLLDGDQRPSNPLPDPGTIPVNQNDTLQGIIDDFAGGAVQFLVDGSSEGGNPSQLITAHRQFISWARSHVDYLPDSYPEAFVWSRMIQNELSRAVTCTNPKECFRELAMRELGYADFDRLTADDIFATQKRRLASIPEDQPDLLALSATLQTFANSRGHQHNVESHP